MRASDLDFDTIRHFQPGEFPEGTLEFMDAELIRQVGAFRQALDNAVVPSPLKAGWVREDGSETSRHYIGAVRRDEDGNEQSERLSDAGDLFPYCDIRHAFMTALSLPFGGIGVYLDTHGPDGKPMPMMHVDLRPGPRQIWMRYKGQYHYPYRNERSMKLFFQKLAEVQA